MVVANVGMPQNARSLLVSPNVAPNTGYLRVAFSDPEKREALAGRDRGRGARDPHARVPRRRGAAVPRRPRRQRLRQRVHGAVRRRGPQRQPRRCSTSRPGPSPTSRAPSPAFATCASRCRSTTRRSASTPTARRPASSGTTAHAAAQTTLDATLGNINTPGRLDRRAQRAVVLRRHLLRRRRASPTPRRSAALPVRVSATGKPVLLGAYGNIHRSVGAVAVERNHLARVAHVLMQTEGRDLGSAAAALEDALRTRPADARRRLPLRRAGRADADHVLRAGPRARPRRDGRLHDHGVAVQVAALAVRHALHDPGVARRASCSRSWPPVRASRSRR